MTTVDMDPGEMDGPGNTWDVVTNHGTVVRCESHINEYLCKHIHTYVCIYAYTWDRGQIHNLWTAVEYEISKFILFEDPRCYWKKGADTWMNCGILRGCYGLEVCKYQVCYLNPR